MTNDKGGGAAFLPALLWVRASPPPSVMKAKDTNNKCLSLKVLPDKDLTTVPVALSLS